MGLVVGRLASGRAAKTPPAPRNIRSTTSRVQMRSSTSDGCSFSQRRAQLVMAAERSPATSGGAPGEGIAHLSVDQRADDQRADVAEQQRCSRRDRIRRPHAYRSFPLPRADCRRRCFYRIPPLTAHPPRGFARCRCRKYRPRARRPASSTAADCGDGRRPPACRSRSHRRERAA
jgi:hypothetical protein